VFTGALIEALCGQGVAKKDGYVRAADLAMYTRERVPGLTKEKQHPVLHFEKADNFVLAYYAGGEKEAKEVSFVLQVDVSEESGMTKIQKSIDNIDKICCKAEDHKAYREFYNLCKENNFSTYTEMSISILSRYAKYKKQCTFGILARKEREIFQNEIRSDFRMLLADFRNEYLQPEK
jgi:hypothetical protein